MEQKKDKTLKMRTLAYSLVASCALLAGAMAPATAQAQDSTDSSAGFQFDISEWLRNSYRTSALRGTKCWKFRAAFGKPAFIELHFQNLRYGHSLVSGTVVRADGVNKKPDRVLMVSGSAAYNEFIGDDETTISRYLLNLTYSFSKTGTNPESAFSEAAFHMRGHYAVRLHPETLDGVFAGNDFVLRWAPPLTGPSRTFSADTSVTGADGVTANYMGGINCEGGSCGDILPLNNAGTWELIGRNKFQCDNARNDFGPDF